MFSACGVIVCLKMNRVVDRILREHGIPKNNVAHVKSTNDEHLFFVNDGYVLRVTEGNNDAQVTRLERIESLDSVQKMLFHGRLESEDCSYVLCEKLKGVDFLEAVSAMSPRQCRELGADVAIFLDALHAITGLGYDIGHYIPIVPRYEGSWRQGHVKYWEQIKMSLAKIEVKPGNQKVLDEAFEYLYSNEEALDFQQGPVLLHNDLHPQNMIVDNAVLSGVIDWECSQFGEPDFELCHFVHWGLYPPESGVDLKPFLRSLVEKMPKCAQVPDLFERLTLYQIEHEMMQMVWSKGKTQDERIPRLIGWMDGRVGRLFN